MRPVRTMTDRDVAAELDHVSRIASLGPLTSVAALARAAALARESARRLRRRDPLPSRVRERQGRRR